MTEAQLDEITRRVSERLAPAAVEQAVTRHVLDVAEPVYRAGRGGDVDI